MSVHMLGGNRSRRGERRQRLRTQSPVPEPKVSHDDIPSTASHAARATSCNRLDASAVNRQEQEDRSKLDEQQEIYPGVGVLLKKTTGQMLNNGIPAGK